MLAGNSAELVGVGKRSRFAMRSTCGAGRFCCDNFRQYPPMRAACCASVAGLICEGESCVDFVGLHYVVLFVLCFLASHTAGNHCAVGADGVKLSNVCHCCRVVVGVRIVNCRHCCTHLSINLCR